MKNRKCAFNSKMIFSFFDGVKKAFCLAGILFAGALGAWGADFTWNGSAGDNLWSTAANWTPSTRYPGGADNVIVTGAAPATLIVDDDITVSNLTVGTAGANKIEIQLTGGTTLTVSGTLNLCKDRGTSSNSVNLVISGDGLLKTANIDMPENLNTHVYSITIENGAQLTVTGSVYANVNKGNTPLQIKGDGVYKFEGNNDYTDSKIEYDENLEVKTSSYVVEGEPFYEGGSSVITISNDTVEFSSIYYVFTKKNTVATNNESYTVNLNGNSFNVNATTQEGTLSFGSAARVQTINFTLPAVVDEGDGFELKFYSSDAKTLQIGRTLSFTGSSVVTTSIWNGDGSWTDSGNWNIFPGADTKYIKIESGKLKLSDASNFSDCTNLKKIIVDENTRLETVSGTDFNSSTIENSGTISFNGGEVNVGKAVSKSNSTIEYADGTSFAWGKKYENLVISGSAGVTASDVVVAGNLTVESGAGAVFNGLSVSGNTVNNGTFDCGASSVVFNGSYSGSGSFIASSGVTTFLSDADFSSCSAFTNNGGTNGGTVDFFNADGAASAITFKFKSEMVLNALNFGGKTDFVLAGDITIGNLTMADGNYENQKYNQTSSFESDFKGTGTLNVTGDIKLCNLNLANSESAITGTLKLNVNTNCSNAIVLTVGGCLKSFKDFTGKSVVNVSGRKFPQPVIEASSGTMSFSGSLDMVSTYGCTGRLIVKNGAQLSALSIEWSDEAVTDSGKTELFNNAGTVNISGAGIVMKNDSADYKIENTGTITLSAVDSKITAGTYSGSGTVTFEESGAAFSALSFDSTGSVNLDRGGTVSSTNGGKLGTVTVAGDTSFDGSFEYSLLDVKEDVTVAFKEGVLQTFNSIKTEGIAAKKVTLQSSGSDYWLAYFTTNPSSSDFAYTIIKDSKSVGSDGSTANPLNFPPSESTLTDYGIVNSSALTTLYWFITKYYWLGTSNTSWSTLANWKQDDGAGNKVAASVVPDTTTGSSEIIIDDAAEKPLVLDSASAIKIKYLQIGSGEKSRIQLNAYDVICTDSLSFSNDGTVVFTGAGRIKDNSATPKAIMDTDSGTVEYGASAGDEGVITNYGSVNTDNDYNNLIIKAGKWTINSTGANIKTAGDFTVETGAELILENYAEINSPLVNNGTVTMNAGAYAFWADFTNNGSVVTNGTLRIENNCFSIKDTGSWSFGDDGTITFYETNDVEFDASGASSLNNYKFNNSSIDEKSVTFKGSSSNPMKISSYSDVAKTGTAADVFEYVEFSAGAVTDSSIKAAASLTGVSFADDVTLNAAVTVKDVTFGGAGTFNNAVKCLSDGLSFAGKASFNSTVDTSAGGVIFNFDDDADFAEDVTIAGTDSELNNLTAGKTITAKKALKAEGKVNLAGGTLKCDGTGNITIASLILNKDSSSNITDNTFDAGSSSISATSVTYDGNNIEITGTVSLGGTTESDTAGNITVTSGNATVTSAVTAGDIFVDGNLTAAGAVTCGAVTINGTLTASGDVSASSVEVGTSGVLNGASGKTITVSGDWTNNNGAYGYSANGGNVVLTGAGADVSGENTFNNVEIKNAVSFADANIFNDLSIDVSALASQTTVTFAAGKVQTVNGSFTAKGNSAENYLLLDSTDPANQWTISFANNPQESSFEYTKVSHSSSVKSDGDGGHLNNDLGLIPSVEEIAEVVPASPTCENWFTYNFFWQGGTSSDWTAVANWTYDAAGSKNCLAYPDLANGTSVISIEKGTKTDSSPYILNLGTGLGGASSVNVKSITVKSDVIFDAGSCEITGNITNNGKIRLAGSQSLSGTMTNGTDSEIEYYGTCDSLPWGPSYEKLTFSSGANTTDATDAITVNKACVLENGSGNSIKLSGNNIFKDAVTIGSAGNPAGTVTLSGNNDFKKTVTIGNAGDVSLTGENIYDGTVTVVSAGDVSLNGNGDGFTLGAGAVCNSLEISCPVALEGNVTTAGGTQKYSGAVQVNDSAELKGSTVTFESTLKAKNGDNLFDVTVNGDAEFKDEVSNIVALKVDGNADFTGAVSDVTTLNVTGDGTFGGAVTAVETFDVDGDAVFNGTIDGVTELAVNGNATFNANAGETKSIGTITVGGETTVNTGIIKTTGIQEYTGAANVTASTTLTGSAVTFGNTLTAKSGDNLFDVTVNGNAEFKDEVSDITALTVTGDGTFDGTIDDVTTLTVTGNAAFNANAGATTALGTITVGGSTTINTAIIKTSGSQNYNDTVTVEAAELKLSTDSTAGVLFSKSVSGSGKKVNFIGGKFTVADGADFEPDLTTSAGTSTVIQGLTTFSGAVANGGSITTADKTVTFLNAVTNNGTFTAAEGDIDFNSTLNNTDSFDCAAGAVTVSGILTNSGTITGSSGSIDFEDAVTNTGTIILDSGAVTVSGKYSGSGRFKASSTSTTFAADADFSSTTFTHNGGTVNFTGAGATIKGNSSTGTSFNIVNFKTICTLNGNNTFDSLYIYDSASITGSNTFAILTAGTTDAGLGGKKITFTAGTTQTVTASLKLNGTSSASLLSLGSSDPESNWNIKLEPSTASYEINYVELTAANNATTLGGNPYYLNAISSVDKGNNKFWNFPGQSYSWNGSADTDWFTKANWTPASVPGLGAKVDVPAGCSNYPVLSLIKASHFEKVSIKTPDDVSETGFGSIVVESGAKLDFAGISFEADLITNNGLARFNGAGSQSVTGEMENGSDSTVEYYGGSTVNLCWDGDKLKDGCQYENLLISGTTTSCQTQLIDVNKTFVIDAETSLAAPVNVAESLTVNKNANLTGNITVAQNVTINDAADLSGKVNVTGTTEILAGTGKTVSLNNESNTFTGAVTLGNSGASPVSAGKVTVVSDGSLKIKEEANADSLVVNGAVVLNGTVTTAEEQTYNSTVTTNGNLTASQINLNGAVTLNKDTILTGSVNFNCGSVSGSGKVFTVNDDAAVLADLSITVKNVAFGNILTGNDHNITITVTDGSTFTGKVSDGASFIVNGDAEFKDEVSDIAALKVDGNADFNDAVSDVTTLTVTGAGTFDGTIDDVTTLSVTGNAAFNANAGETRPLETITVGGTTTINTAIITTTQTQNYTGAANVTASTTLTASAVTFGNILTANNKDITVNVTDGSTFTGKVSNSTNFTVNGDADFKDAVSDVTTFTVTGDGTFDGTIDNVATLAVTGNAVFNANAGATTALGTIAVGGTTAINADLIKTSLSQLYDGAVELKKNSSLETASSSVTFNSDVTGSFGLTITNSSVTFGDTTGEDKLEVASISFINNSALDHSLDAQNCKVASSVDWNFEGSSTQKISVVPGPSTYGNVTVNIEGTLAFDENPFTQSSSSPVSAFDIMKGSVTTGANTFVCGNLSVKEGASFTQTGNNGSKEHSVVNMTNNGAITWDSGCEGGTLVINGTVSGIKAASILYNKKTVTLNNDNYLSGVFWDLTIPSGVKLTNEKLIRVRHNMNIENNGKYIHNEKALVFGNDLENPSVLSGAGDGTIKDDNGEKQNLGNATVNDSTKTAASSLKAKNLTITAGTTFDSSIYDIDAEADVTNKGSWTVTSGNISAGGDLTNDESLETKEGDITVAGEATNSGTLTTDSGKVTVSQNFTNNKTFSSKTGSVTVTGDLTNTDSFTAADGDVSVTGNLLNSGTFTSDATVSVSKNLTDTTTGTWTGSNTIIFNGDDDQSFNPNSSTTYYGVNFANTSSSSTVTVTYDVNIATVTNETGVSNISFDKNVAVTNPADFKTPAVLTFGTDSTSPVTAAFNGGISHYSGSTVINGALSTVNSPVHFKDTASTGADIEIDAGTALITFDGNVTASGATQTFNSSVVTTSALTTFTAETVTINCASIKAESGVNKASQTYKAKVVTGPQDTLFELTGSLIFEKTLSGDSAYSVAINAENVRFDDDVSDYKDFTADCNTITFNSSSSLQGVSTSGNQTYKGDVKLNTDSVFASSQGALVKFEKTLGNADSKNVNLTIAVADVEFNSDVTVKTLSSEGKTSFVAPSPVNTLTIATTGHQIYKKNCVIDAALMIKADDEDESTTETVIMHGISSGKGSLTLTSTITELYAADYITDGKQTFNSTKGIRLLAGENGTWKASSIECKDSPLFVDCSASAMTLECDLSARNIMFYSGSFTVNSGKKVEATDIAMWGKAYSADDPRYSGADSRFAYFDLESGKKYKDIYAPASGFGTELTASGAYFKVTGNFYNNGVNLTGLNLTIPDNSSSSPEFNSTKAVTEKQWGIPYAVSFNTELKEVTVDGGWLTAGRGKTQNCTDNGGNTNIQFYVPHIDEAYTVYDDVVYVHFDMELENSNGEIARNLALYSNNKLELGGAWYSSTTSPAAFNYSGAFKDADCTQKIGENEDIQEFYLRGKKKSDGTFETWNTDATGSSPYNNAQKAQADSSDRAGIHKRVTADINFLEGLFTAASGHTMCRNYGTGLEEGESAPSYTDTEDHASPVLIAVYTGQELHKDFIQSQGAASQMEYDSHNFIEFRYSEAVDMGNLLNDGEAINARGENDFDGDNHGGNIKNSSSEIKVEGYGKLSGKIQTGIRPGSSSGSTAALYRKFGVTAADEPSAQTHRVRVSIAGYVDGTVKYEDADYDGENGTFHNWIAYIDSNETETPAGTVERIKNKNIRDIAVRSDSTVNKLESESTENHPLPELTVNTYAQDSIAAGSSLYGKWDTIAPAIAPFTKNEDHWREPWENLESSEIIGSSLGSFLDRIEIHFLDNNRNSIDKWPKWWRTRKGWQNNGEDSSVSLPESAGGARPFTEDAAQTTGGIRRSSLMNAASSFIYKAVTDNVESAEKSFDADIQIRQKIKGGIFRKALDKDTTNDSPYASLPIVSTENLPIRTTFVLTYDPSADYITDLAGNRLASTYDKKTEFKSPDMTAPSYSMTLSPVAQNKIYAIFTKELAYANEKGDYIALRNTGSASELNKAMEEIKDSFVVCNSKTADKANEIEKAEFVSGNKDYTAILFTLKNKVTLSDIENLWLRNVGHKTGGSVDMVEDFAGFEVADTKILDENGNYLPQNKAHAISDFAVNAADVIYAYAQDKNDDDWNEQNIYGTNIARDSEGYSVHDFTRTQGNYGKLVSGRDVVLQVRTIAGVESDGTYTAPEESFLLMPLKKTSLTKDMVSDKINKLTGSDWRIWLPSALTSLASTPATNLLTLPSAPVSADSGNGILWNYSFPQEDYGFKGGDEVQFVFKVQKNGSDVLIDHDADDDNLLISASPTNKVPLYAVRMPETKIRAGDFSFIDLWSFGFKDLKKQRGGATILNNVIDVSVKEQTVVEVDMKEEGNLNVYVMTIDGNIVKKLAHGRYKAGTHYFRWNGTNNAGNSVARGMYFIRISGPEIDETRKVMCVKSE